MNNSVVEFLAAVNASHVAPPLGGQEIKELLGFLRGLLSSQFAADMISNSAARLLVDRLFASEVKVQEEANSVGSGLGVIPPTTPPSAVVTTPIPESSPTASTSSVPPPVASTASDMKEIETPRAFESGPSPTASAQSPICPLAPDMQERPAANYVSPGGRREAVWDSEEEEKDEAAMAPRVTPKRRRLEPEEKHEFSVEALQAQLENGQLLQLNMIPTTLEGYIGMIGAHHDMDLSAQAITAREKEINKAKLEILRLRLILAGAHKADVLAQWCRTARMVVNAKK